ncbi:hypothetical protein GSI_05788 [Ganoderma sinense ZZ0214-1]|uniref:F-box domain-containing protein n=1 Tax=Ganoderma sinense ZZ0214-1 TaxID=1077348 RepID=A0A2G8SBI0_9APHY|nr:hypothetical protein GSI_05788 [Ganoderma sinense ZZ0214-1]
MSPVYLRDDKAVDSFHRFIFADEAARAARTYLGSSFPISPAAVHLEYLSVPSSLPTLNPIIAAAANTTSLHELSIALDISLISPLRLMGCFLSPLRSLCIGTTAQPEGGISARLLYDHIAIFAPTLQVLELAQEVNLDIASSSVTTQFTAVRSLKIHSLSEFNKFTMEALIRLFPNLDGTLVLDDVFSIEAENGYSDMRERREYGDAEDLARWAGMDIRVPRDHSRPYLAPALRHNYPRLLHLCVSFGDDLSDLCGLFAPEGASNLTHLVIFVGFRVSHQWRGAPEPSAVWDHFVNELIVGIKHLLITHLRLVVHCDIDLVDDPAGTLPKKDPTDTDVVRVGKMDLRPAATQLASAMPTLRYIFLTSCGCTHRLVPHDPWGLSTERQMLDKWFSSKAWQVVHAHAHDSDDGPSNVQVGAACQCTVTELSGGAAAKIVDEEGLELSRGEEVDSEPVSPESGVICVYRS